MWTGHVTGGERVVRSLLAFALIGFSFQTHTTLSQAMAGYLVGGFLLMSVLGATYTATARK